MLNTVDVVVGLLRGPVVRIIVGVDGDEYEGVLAGIQLGRELSSEVDCGEAADFDDLRAISVNFCRPSDAADESRALERGKRATR